MAREEQWKRLTRSVASSRTEERAVNEVVRMLEAIGYGDGTKFELSETIVPQPEGGRGKLRFYIWYDTPFGDDVVLAAGPSWQPKVALGRQIPAKPGVGIYIQGLLQTGRTQRHYRAEKAATRSRASRAEKPARTRRSTVVEETETAAEAVQAASVAVQALEQVERAAEKPKRGGGRRKKATEAQVARVEEKAAEAVEAAAAAVEAQEVAARAESEAREAARKAQEEADRIAAEAKSQRDREAAETVARGQRAAKSFLAFLDDVE